MPESACILEYAHRIKMHCAWVHCLLMCCVITLSHASIVGSKHGVYNADSIDFLHDCPVTCDAQYETFQQNQTYSVVVHAEIPEGIRGTYDAQFWQNSITWQTTRCVQCADILAIDGTVLPRHAYTLNSDCEPTCVFPYQHYPEYNHTCVLCDATPPIGHYLAGPTCTQFKPCVSQKQGPHWHFVSGGVLDDPHSCTEHCTNDTFADVTTVNGVVVEQCLPHTMPVCTDTQFLVSGTHSNDAYCEDCQFECEGFFMTQVCVPGSGPQMQCEKCEKNHGELQFGELWTGHQCVKKCISGWVRNTVTGHCEICDHVCAPGTEFKTDRQNCTDCAACSNSRPHSVYVVGCEWQCMDYYAYDQATDQCVSVVQAVPAMLPSVSWFSLRCEPWQHLTASGCQDCALTVTVPSTGQGERWNWTASRTSCSWACLPGFYSYTIGKTQRCYTWEEYLVQIGTVSNSNSTLEALQTGTITFNSRRRTTIPMLSEWQLLLIALLLIFTAIYAFS